MERFLTIVGLFTCAILGGAVWIYVCSAVMSQIETDIKRWRAKRERKGR